MIVDPEKALIIVKDGLHSAWGPSGAKKWINCPGSINAAKGRPSKSSSYANEGTAAHAVSELCREHNESASRYKGWTVRVARGEEFSDHLCDQEMVDSVQEFVDYCNDVPAEMVLIEQLLPYAEYVEPGFGTLDDARLSDNLCVITDFKHGKGVQVFAEENEQLMLQALSVFLKYENWFEFSKFVLRIAQPRLGHFDEWETTLDEILKWAGTVAAPGYLATLEPNAPRYAGDWCQFCPAKYDCDERAKTMLGHLVGDFEDITEATENLKSCETNTGVMSSADIARCLSVLDQIKAWAKDIEAHARLETLAGRPPQAPGEDPWFFTESRSKRIYIVPEDELIEELKEEGLKESDIYTRKLISPAKLEKKIGKKHEIMKTCVKKPPGRPKLVPPTDKRKPMEAALIAQFADLGEEKEEDENDD